MGFDTGIPSSGCNFSIATSISRANHKQAAPAFQAHVGAAGGLARVRSMNRARSHQMRAAGSRRQPDKTARGAP